MQDAARLDLHKKGIKFIVDPGGANEGAIAMAGEAASEGWYVMTPYPLSTETDLPGMTPMLEAAQKYRRYGVDKVTLNYIRGWVCSAVSASSTPLPQP